MEKIGPFGTTITKDPNIEILEQKVLKQLNDLLPKQETEKNFLKIGVRTVSFEDAVKELLKMSKNS